MKEASKMFSLSTILIVVLAITTILSIAYIIRLSNRVRTLESVPAPQLRDSTLDEEAVKE